jgi:hypothetical protein
MDERTLYTQNRNAAVEESCRELRDHAGSFAARSLDGRRTYAYAPTVSDLRCALAAQSLALADVVIERIDYNVIDIDCCRVRAEPDQVSAPVEATV